MTETTVEFLQWLTAIAFVVLAIVALLQWQRDRDSASGWLALTFLSIGAVALAGRVLPEDFENEIVTKIEIAVLVLFPYALYRFGATFRPHEPPALKFGAAALTAVVIVWGALLPELPSDDEPRSSFFVAFLFALLIQWVALSLIVSVQFWRAGRDQPDIARRRTRLLSGAAGLMSLAIILAVAVPVDHPIVIDVLIQLLVLGSAVAFFFGFTPPEPMRAVWRRSALDEMRGAVSGLLTSTTEAEVTKSLLPRMSAIVGAHGIALVDEGGKVIDSSGITVEMLGEIPELLASDPDPRQQDHWVMRFPFGSLVLWTSPYTPFFGAEDLELLNSVGTLAHLALERTRALDLRVQLAEAKLRRRQALDINDNIVQGLAVAKYAFDLGEEEKGRKAVNDTLQESRRIVRALLEELEPEEGMRPGMLVRDRPAREPNPVLQQQASDHSE
jgi:signal transduction histidine kinase